VFSVTFMRCSGLTHIFSAFILLVTCSPHWIALFNSDVVVQHRMYSYWPPECVIVLPSRYGGKENRFGLCWSTPCYLGFVDRGNGTDTIPEFIILPCRGLGLPILGRGHFVRFVDTIVSTVALVKTAVR
jgi:hypothetical protein